MSITAQPRRMGKSFSVAAAAVAFVLLLGTMTDRTSASALRDAGSAESESRYNHRFYARSLGDAIDTTYNVADADMTEYMKRAIVKRMFIQDMVDGTLIVGQEVVSFDDEHLEMIHVAMDGSDSNLFQVLDSGREFTSLADGVTIRVIKRDGVVVTVLKHIPTTGEKISVELMDDGVSYATYTTDDVDLEQLGQIRVDTKQPSTSSPSAEPLTLRDIHEYRVSSAAAGGHHRNLQTNCPNGVQVVRLNVHFDSDFCRRNGSTVRAAEDRIDAIIADFNDAYAVMCVTVKTCGVQGFCTNGDDDPLSRVIKSSNDFCGNNVPLIDQFRDYIYPNRQNHFSKYGNDVCDATHLMFGAINGRDPFNGSTIGCAYTNAICNRYAVGANQAGAFSSLSGQSSLVGHELGHNLGADHDNGSGFLMSAYSCRAGQCETFSRGSINQISNFADDVDNFRCIGFQPSLTPPSPTPPPPTPRPPTPSPPTPRPPTPSPPTPSPPSGDRCEQFSGRRNCVQAFNRGKVCTFVKINSRNKFCRERANMECSDYVDSRYCVRHGTNCEWDANAGRCQNE